MVGGLLFSASVGGFLSPFHGHTDGRVQLARQVERVLDHGVLVGEVDRSFEDRIGTLGTSHDLVRTALHDLFLNHLAQIDVQVAAIRLGAEDGHKHRLHVLVEGARTVYPQPLSMVPTSMVMISVPRNHAGCTAEDGSGCLIRDPLKGMACPFLARATAAFTFAWPITSFHPACHHPCHPCPASIPPMPPMPMPPMPL